MNQFSAIYREGDEVVIRVPIAFIAWGARLGDDATQEDEDAMVEAYIRFLWETADEPQSLPEPSGN